MKSILHKTILLSLMTVFAIGTVVAQPPSSKPIEPGTKGNLPALKDVPAATEGILPILHLEMITGTYIFSTYYQELMLTFPTAQSLGGQYYLLQYKDGDSWANCLSDDGPAQFEGDNAAPIVGNHIYSNVLRLKLVGGEKNGWVSNTITVPNIADLNCFLSTLDHSWTDFVGAGIMLRNCKAYVEKHTDGGKKEEYDENCEYYKYQWYRRNPNTYDMTLIEDATGFEYTPTIDDVGYEIVKVVTGDNEHLGFYGAHTDGIVKMPIEASIEYMDRNGFVLNTSYVLPDGGKGLCLSAEPGDPYSKSVPFPEGSVKELKPGQYAVSINVEQYEGYEVRYADDRYRVAFLYEMPDWGGDGQMKTTYREAQLMPDRYKADLMIKTMCGDEVVNGTIDIIGKNQEGKLEVVTTMTTEQLQEEGLTLPVAQQYYVKIRNTDNTLETYYPDALTWEDAKPIEPKMYDGSEDFHVTVAFIEVQPGFTPLDGNATIKGKIDLINRTTARVKVRKTEGDGYTVYLKDKSSNSMIAMTQTDAEGNYQFDKVPVGSYEVIPNVEGYKAGSANETTITEKDQVVEVDCTMNEVAESELFPDSSLDEEVLAGDANDDGTVNAADIVELVNYIMGHPSDKFNGANADANDDGSVNAADIVMIVNIIMGKV